MEAAYFMGSLQSLGQLSLPRLAPPESTAFSEGRVATFWHGVASAQTQRYADP